MRAASAAPGLGKGSSNRWLLLGLLGAVLLALFYQSLDPHQILFANDAPLGPRTAEWSRLPGRFAGTWSDLTWLGAEAPSASPNITMLMSTLLSPVAFLKIYTPFTLLFLGFSAWLFFRQLNFSPIVCVLGGVAACLNAHFLSIACWGLGHWEIAAGCSFLAIAALYAKSIPKIWEKAVLAGLAVGMGVMEGFDVGAILSVYIGIFILFRLLNDDVPVSRKVVNILVAETLVVLFAGIIAFHTMDTLVETQVEGVGSMGQDVETKESRWNPATQWSLPKLETLQVFVPGLFGYRLSGNIDQKDHSSSYWGMIGQDPRIASLGSDDPIVRSNVLVSLKLPNSYQTNLDTPDRDSRTPGMLVITKKSGIYWRYSGSSECAGVIVSLFAMFGLANLFRKDRPYSKSEGIAVAFWGVVALISLLASWGRYGFLYQYIYKLPYLSTIRNPIKFMHPFHIAWIILAAYGMEVLYRRCLRNPERSSLNPLLQSWWKKVSGFDRRWIICMMILAAISVAATAMLCVTDSTLSGLPPWGRKVAHSLLFINKSSLIRYLQDQTFTPLMAAGNSRNIMGIANFCLQQVGLFTLFLIAGMMVIATVLLGTWTKSNHKLVWGILALLMICDLLRADYPWVHYYDYTEKYALDPVTELLLDKPWEHRVIGKLEPKGPGSGIQPGFGQLYFYWLQNEFPYHNIQALDFPQMSHMPDLDRTYLKAFELSGDKIQTTDLRPAMRLWQLTNTRYVLATANAMEFLNRRTDTNHPRFELNALFRMIPKPGVEAVNEISDVTVETGPKGDFGVIEDTQTLPRAKLYSNWRTPADDAATLDLLANNNFEPWNTVLIATNTPVPQPNSNLATDPGTVDITDYRSKYIRLEADAKTPAVLLLNDRTGPDWQVRIDGARAPMLRCNYIMRGVFVPPGHHTVEFLFRPSLRSLYISLSAIVVGIILAGYLIATRQTVAAPEAPPAPVVPAIPVPPAKPVVPPAKSAARPPPAVALAGKGGKGNGKAKRT